MAVNLHSDTQTRPTPAMREAMAAAEVGDEQRGQDPTTRELERRVTEILGHAAAVFLASGTMCNEIALRLHIRPGGDELLLDRTAHPIVAEAGGPAALAGAVIAPPTAKAASSPRNSCGRRCTWTGTATRRARAPSRSSRRRTWAAGASGRLRGSKRCWGSCASTGCARTWTAPG